MPTQVDLIINTRANGADLEKMTREAQAFIDTIKLGVGIDIGGRLVEGIGQIGEGFKGAVIEGVKFNETVQDAQLALAAMLKNFDPEKFHTLNEAMAESAKGVDLLRQKAVQSPFNFSTLLETLQGISAPLFAAGVKDLQKQIDLTLLLSQASKTLNIPQQQFLPDARDLVSGRIGRTQLGRSLGISDEDIKKATQAGQLYEMLTQKLAAYGEAGAKSLDNYSTRATDLYDALQQLEGVATEGTFNQISDLTNDLTTAIKTPEFVNAAKTVGAEIEVVVAEVSTLIQGIAAAPGVFLAAGQAVVVFSTSLALLGLPKLVMGIVQLSEGMVPAIANMARMGTVAQGEAVAIGEATAATEANTVALTANEEAGAAGAGFGAVASFAGPAVVAVLALTQAVQAYYTYQEMIKEGNDGLEKQLGDIVEHYKELVQQVSTQADKSKLILDIANEQDRMEKMAQFARDHGLETNERTYSLLDSSRQAMGDLANHTEKLTDAEIQQRAATQATNAAIDAQYQAIGKLGDGYEKAREKYRLFALDQQAKHGATQAERTDAANQGIQEMIDDLNKRMGTSFSGIGDAEAFVKPEANNAAVAQLTAVKQAALDAVAAQEKVVKEKQRIADLFGKPDPAHGRPADMSKDAQDQAGAAADTLRQLQDQARIAGENLSDYNSQQTETMKAVQELKGAQGDILTQQKEGMNDTLKTDQATYKAQEEDLERSLKNRTITLDQYYATRLALIKKNADAEIQAVKNGGEPADRQASAIDRININAGVATAKLNQERPDKYREQTVQDLKQEEDKLSLQREQAVAAGDVNRAEDLDHQIAIKQAIAAIEGNAILNEAEKKSRIEQTVAAMDQQYAATQRQKIAEQNLEIAEKKSADALSDLQAKRQEIEGSTLSPDAKNSALRELLLQENTVLDQQIALLEKRRELALEDPSKSPNDRALTALGIQGQINQTQQQKTGNDIAAQKLTFTGQFIDDLSKFNDSFGSTAQQAANVVTGTLGTAVQSLSKNLYDVIAGTESLKEAFVNMAIDAIDQLIQLAVKMAVVLALQVAIDAATSDVAPALGAASGGGFGIQGFASLLGFAGGGLVPGAPSHSDNRIAMIASGEYVARTAAVNYYGPGLFEALNQMVIPRHGLAGFDFPVHARSSLGFADGGLVAPLPFLAGTTAQTSSQFHSHTNIGLINTQRGMQEFMRSGQGKKIILDMVDGRMRDIGVTS